jgi:hypothetical protein
MIAQLNNPVTIGDLINAIAAITTPLDGSVDETGLTVVADGKPIRIAFLTEPNRYDVAELDRFASAAAAYDREGRHA